MSTQNADAAGVPEPPAKVVAVADQVASAVDHAVPVSDEPANRVLVDNARLVRWAAPAFVICSLMLLPWIVVLGTTLPQRQFSQHYRLAWTGYDVLLALGLACTAVAAVTPLPTAPDNGLRDRCAACRRRLVRRAHFIGRPGCRRSRGNVRSGGVASRLRLLLARGAQPRRRRAATAPGAHRSPRPGHSRWPSPLSHRRLDRRAVSGRHRPQRRAGDKPPGLTRVA